MCIGSNSVNQAQDLMIVTKIKDLPNSLLPSVGIVDIVDIASPVLVAVAHDVLVPAGHAEALVPLHVPLAAHLLPGHSTQLLVSTPLTKGISPSLT